MAPSILHTTASSCPYFLSLGALSLSQNPSRCPQMSLPQPGTSRHLAVQLRHKVSRRPRADVFAEYSDRRSGGAGDFVAGFLLGGVIFGALGYLIAPQVNKTIAAADKETEGVEEEEGPPKKLPSRFFEDDEGLEKTRKNLNEKIAQLNAAIDDVSAQLKDEGAFGSTINESALELESAA